MRGEVGDAPLATCPADAAVRPEVIWHAPDAVEVFVAQTDAYGITVWSDNTVHYLKRAGRYWRSWEHVFGLMPAEREWLDAEIQRARVWDSDDCCGCLWASSHPTSVYLRVWQRGRVGEVSIVSGCKAPQRLKRLADYVAGELRQLVLRTRCRPPAHPHAGALE